MLKYKVGDIVTLNDKVDVDQAMRFRPGVQVKIENLCDNFPCPSDYHYTVRLVSNSSKVWWIKDFEIEEKQMKPTDKITVEITLAELAKIYAVMGKANGDQRCSLYDVAQNKLDPTNKRGMFMQKIEGASALDYNRYEKEFMKLMFPEPPKKSKEQIKIDELQATIDKAVQQIKELKEGK